MAQAERMTPLQRALKRCLDLAISLGGLLILSRPLRGPAGLVRLSSPGPAFFVQTRVGRHGRPFRWVKFCTMQVGEAGSPVTLAGDARITEMGRFLRRHKLDEWPQLWNVLVGHMSLVGPQPDVPGYADRLERSHFRRQNALLPTVPNPGEYNDIVVWPTKVEMNLHYLNTWTVWTDTAVSSRRSCLGGRQ